MALPKRVKVGGAYYKGYKTTVSSAGGSYNTMIINTGGAAVNGISITPDQYGQGDTMSVQHLRGTDSGDAIIVILAENIYNAGQNASVMLDFPAAELVNSGEALKFTYLNTASVAMNVHLIVEFVGINKTA